MTPLLAEIWSQDEHAFCAMLIKKMGSHSGTIGLGENLEIL